MQITLPQMVRGKAEAAGEVGLQWLAQLGALVARLEAQWNIRVEDVMQGGSHALVCAVTGENGEPLALKIEIPDIPEEEYLYGIRALQIADGNGYVKLIAFDPEKRSCLLERLGQPLRLCGYSPREQMAIICRALKETWQMPVLTRQLQQGSLAWFEDYLPHAWAQLGEPCPQKVLHRALHFLEERKREQDPEGFVLLHGDAHNNNILQVPSRKGDFKLIDPEGLLYEKAYDLGVLMREWPEEYRTDPIRGWLERAEYLSMLTGVDAGTIRAWGYLQMVSTAFILLQIGQQELGREMLRIAEAWCDYPATAK